MTGRMKLLMKQIWREAEAGAELEQLLSRYLLTEAEKEEIRTELGGKQHAFN